MLLSMVKALLTSKLSAPGRTDYVTEVSSVSITEFIEVGDRLAVSLELDGITSRQIGFDSYIKQVFENRILVHIPENLSMESFLVPDTPVTLEFQKDRESMPVIRTSIVRYSKENQGIWLIVPPDFKDFFLKRRRHVRIPVRFPVKIHYWDNQREIAVSGISINLSGGGMRFVTSKGFEPGSRIRVEFQPETRLPPFRLQAEIVMCKPSHYKATRSPHDEMMIAVKFINLLPTQEDQLVGICFRQELEQQRHLKNDL